MSDNDKGKGGMPLGAFLIFVVAFFLMGIICGNVFIGGVNRGEPDRSIDLATGNHQILAVVEVTADSALVVLKHENLDSKPHYYKIEAKKVLNFEDISSAKEVIKVDGDLKYIQFK